MIDRIRYGQFEDVYELRYLEGQRALLHQQLVELLGREEVTVEQVRALALLQPGEDWDDQ